MSRTIGEWAAILMAVACWVSFFLAPRIEPIALAWLLIERADDYADRRRQREGKANG